MHDNCDVLIVSGGPGGYMAAIRAGQLGLHTALVEKQHLGGICLNWGYILTKTLLHGTKVACSITHASQLGVNVDGMNADLQGLVQSSHAISQQLIDGVEYLLKRNGAEVIDGTAQLRGKGQIMVANARRKAYNYQADHVTLAAGARPRTLPSIEPGGEYIWTYYEALQPKLLPRSLLVIGSGATGVELASLYNNLGCKVTLVELASQILPIEDARVPTTVRRSFEKRGIQVHIQTQVTQIQLIDTGIRCIMKSTSVESFLKAEHVLLTAGVRPSIEDLGLEALGVELDRGFVKAGAAYHTSVFGLYAIGDVADSPCLAYKASYEGVICTEMLAGVEGAHPLNRDYVSDCAYSWPQAANLDLTESMALARGRSIRTGKFSRQSNDKALASGETEGFAKTIFDAETGGLLGAHIISVQVTEQIQGSDIAHHLETTDKSLLSVVFAHPTLSKAIHESVLVAYGHPLHQ